MYYKIVENFGPEAGERWGEYLRWRCLQLARFDSVDGILRPDLFHPESRDDWSHCVNEDHKLSLLTSLDYARRILSRYENPRLVGVEIELGPGFAPKEGFLGYDIIDGYCEVSLVTNWGTDEGGSVNPHVMENGLLGDLDLALRIRDQLREGYPDDPHAGECQVWAVYQVS